MSEISQFNIDKLVDAVRGISRQEARKVASEHRTTTMGTVSRIENDGVIWVNLAGSDEETPVTVSSAEVKEGEQVSVVVRNGYATIMGNVTSPSVGTGDVIEIVEPVDRKASEAIADANAAHAAADYAESEAQRAANAANAAQESADAAAQAAGVADEKAVEAGQAAADAQSSASAANIAANNALNQLSFVEDVAGTLQWIQEHGSFSLTEDTTVVEGKIYFELVEGEYVPVAQPSGNPQTSGWYELDITDSQTDYILAHLAVTSAGLWVLPSGIDSQGGARYSSGYKLLLASDGARIYDSNGQLVSTYGESIEFSSSRPQHIGGENAYITYYDSDNDGVPDSIYIGGSNVSIGGKTLSQFEQAITDASIAKKYAEDVPIVTLSSTNGTTFKRNLGVSTTLIATIFTPGGRIDNATELHRRFGAGAYLAWGWRDVVTEAEHILVSTDSRIIMDGFGLVVSPEDIDSQAVITCSLNY